MSRILRHWSRQVEAALEGRTQELAAVVKDAECLRQEVARLAPLEALTVDLQRECSRLHDTSDMCAHASLPISQSVGRMRQALRCS